MAKRKHSLKVRLPPYSPPRNQWRIKIHSELIKAARRQKIKYSRDVYLALEVILYLHEREIIHHDVDNRLKDIMDALQGRAGGSKKKHTFTPLVPNDHQIFKVTLEKRVPPKQSKGWMHLKIKEYKY